jgi:O-methyltransferase involved in polyketide biosynthesis
MEKQSTHAITDAVADTLFIPLYMRCLETREQGGIIHDPAACQLVDQLDYDFSRYDQAPRSRVGTCIRVRHFDEAARRFIDSHPDPVVINLGCGLDTRAQRVGRQKALFYNLDLPEVIQLRESLLPADERNISMARSLFDGAWAEEIRTRHPNADMLVIAEGVFMYFPEEQIRPVIQQIASTLAPGELVFDACTSTGCKISSRHDTIKHTRAVFRWGLDNDALPQQWARNLRLLEVEYYMDKEKHRWDLPSRVMRFIPPLAHAFKMLRYSMRPLETISGNAA